MPAVLPNPLYTTQLGQAYVGDSLDLLPRLSADSVDLVITSPPFALQRQKEYGNETEDAHVDWLLQFAEPVKRVLKPTGSFVLDLGGAYQSGRPVRSLYNFRVMLRLCDEHGFRLAEEFFWHNPAKLPSPIEWVNKRKIRAKDSVNTVWWFAKADFPKADVRRVLAPLRADEETAGKPRELLPPETSPSGHDISGRFASDNGGAIPSNLLQIPNTESNSAYQRHYATVGVKLHPARFRRSCPRSSSNSSPIPVTPCSTSSPAPTPPAARRRNSTGAGWLSRKTAPIWPHPHSASWTNCRRKKSPRSGANCMLTMYPSR